jgi:outer membrane protein OmpA-like peptidoglycan-associated protein
MSRGGFFGPMVIALLIGAFPVPPAAAAAKYVDPDAPATQEAARQALSNAKVLDIVGLVRSVDATLKDLGATVTETEIKIALSADVLFDFDKADLRPEARPQLEKVASVLKEHPQAPVLIEGHTDNKGTGPYNQALSERRAESVRRWLVASGVTAPMTTRGLGESRPVAANTKPDGSDDPEGRQRNRRVEITVKTR